MMLLIRRRPLLLLTLLAGLGAPALAAADGVPREAGADPTAAASRLATWTAAPDPSSTWSERTRGRYRGVDYRELRLVSQTWRGEPWRHQLFLLRPDGVRPGAPGFLFISGGRWKTAYDEPPVPGRLPRDAAIFARVAHRLQAPVAVLGQVPFQPMFDGLREDALIAYSFDQYLKTGEPDWPLLLPMVKAARVAMDAVQATSAAEWQLPVDRFVVAGASKRGWTTWLTAASQDPRVAAIAPMVIDVLDMPRQMAHQRATWGAESVQIQDYTARDLNRRMLSPEGEGLLAIIDPWRHRQSLAQPKLIVLATNDAYWPVDAANIYLDGLPGESRLLYLPNNEHSVRDLRRLVAGFAALHGAARDGSVLPRLEWQHAGDGGQATLRYRSDVPATGARAWYATAPTRDFRSARWIAKPARRVADGWYQFKVPVPQQGYVALLGEAEYGLGRDRYYLSTGLRVIGSEGVLPLTNGPPGAR